GSGSWVEDVCLETGIGVGSGVEHASALAESNTDGENKRGAAIAFACAKKETFQVPSGWKKHFIDVLPSVWSTNFVIRTDYYGSSADAKAVQRLQLSGPLSIRIAVRHIPRPGAL